MKEYKIFWKHKKNGKENNYNVWWYWNRKTEISPTLKAISIKYIDSDKIAVSNKVSSGKKGLYMFNWLC